jgi:hypothetical protein
MLSLRTTYLVAAITSGAGGVPTRVRGAEIHEIELTRSLIGSRRDREERTRP